MNQNLQTAFFEKIDLHREGDMGYHLYRIPGLITTKKGTVLAWYDARKGRGSDWDPIDIMLNRSHDNGKTWEGPQIVVSRQRYGESSTINNLILISDRISGDIHALYCVNYETMYYMRSEDDGYTFSEPVNATGVMETFKDRYDWRVIAPGPGHGLQLANGRLVVPVWMSTGEGEEFLDPSKRGHRPSDVVAIYSDDHGRTWKPGDFVARTGPECLHPSETVAVQLSDDRVLFNIRTETDTNRRYVSTSPDGAFNWSKPTLDPALEEPICFGSIMALPNCGDKGVHPILFANPSSLEHPASLTRIHDSLRVQTYAREHLTVKVSYDDCRTWPVTKLVEADGAKYSDLCVAADGTILCLYERGKRIPGAERMQWYMTVARFNMAWLEH